ncbi:hypothetical protein N7510_004060 [Penicillium lagena]|uniref:uncharacterized protein n=1 Tax=Penicillium lagena TaxID=94218 RepID=UPI002541A359|nr:uncharacterized protein N7510_004060 [Penicillium lagena]KAJ5620076.1 hypothetical protein N7510_004060 [Penicillium lagena]
MSSANTQNPAQLPWDPNCSRFPVRKDLPRLPDAPEGAAWVWGEDDQNGRLNLLTPQRVKESAAEILTGEMVRLDLPLTVPEKPAFGRETFQHNIKTIVPDVAYDDIYSMNTQSGTQWDGFRHDYTNPNINGDYQFSHIPTKTFYNRTKSSDIVGPTSNDRCSIHHWALHGIAGRGILLDYWGYANANNKVYDPYSSHAISLPELRACASWQGLDLRPSSEGGSIRVGDILLVRSGFVARYGQLSPVERYAASTRAHDNLCFAGVARGEEMKDFLHDSYFAAVAGDSPTFEMWPVKEGGGLFASESAGAVGVKRGKWTFFLTSAPANMPGGVGSHANATAIL